MEVSSKERSGRQRIWNSYWRRADVTVGSCGSSCLIISPCSLEEVKDFLSHTMTKTVHKMSQYITKTELKPQQKKNTSRYSLLFKKKWHVT